MRYRSSVAAIATVCLLLVGCIATPGLPNPTPPPHLAPATATSPPATVGPSPPPADTETPWPAGPTGPFERATLVRVVDGDTIRAIVDGVEQRIRYIGIDTPESVAPGTPVEPFSLEATEENRRLLARGELILERDVSEVDRFGRLLRYVWVRHPSGEYTFVNLELVLRGYAQVATFPPDVRYTDHLLAAQREAREAGRGSWAP